MDANRHTHAAPGQDTPWGSTSGDGDVDALDAQWARLVEAELTGFHPAPEVLPEASELAWDGEFQGYDPEYVHATITASLAADPGVGVGGLAGGFEALGDVP
ncbi:hypothetical protein, partial [Phytoactinopolyspora limicola]|uniref:hypothetical protein n=1 Tax=Phytoactinopolyspora limicola TaxID=2715536 RepID=UPI00140BE307